MNIIIMIFSLPQNHLPSTTPLIDDTTHSFYDEANNNGTKLRHSTVLVADLVVQPRCIFQPEWQRSDPNRLTFLAAFLEGLCLSRRCRCRRPAGSDLVKQYSHHDGLLVVSTNGYTITEVSILRQKQDPHIIVALHYYQFQDRVLVLTLRGPS